MHVIAAREHCSQCACAVKERDRVIEIKSEERVCGVVELEKR